MIIEVAVPRGGVTSYGLLGARFEPAHSASLAMSVLSDGDRSFNNALAGSPERVEFGLPPEYVSSVVSGFLSGARQFEDGDAMGRCTSGGVGPIEPPTQPQ